MRFLATIALLVLASIGFGATTSNTIDLTAVTVKRNAIPASFTTTAQVDTVNVICGSEPVLAELLGTKDWTYTDPVSNVSKNVTATTPLRLEFYGTSAFKVTRVAADGVVTFQILKLIK